MAQELAEGYYLENFKTLIGFVESIYSDLLLDTEKDFINKFNELSVDAARLWVRLCMRTKPFYFKHQLQYSEIKSFDLALEELKVNNFILLNQGVIAIEVISALSKDELKNIFNDRKINFRLNKEELISAIENEYAENEIFNAVFSKHLLVFKNKSNIVEIILHFFFGNRHQDLTEFVLQDLGLVRYEKYCLDGQSRLFQSREQFEQSVLLSRLSEESYLAVEAEDESAILQVIDELPKAAINYRLESRFSKVINRCAYYFEREGNIELALSLYAKATRGHARERQARILYSQNLLSEARGICESILTKPYSQDEEEFASKFLLKLDNQKAIKSKKIQLNESHLQIKQQEDISVEQMAVHFLSNSDIQVFYVENTLLNSLFGLWHWEIIFAPIAGAFCHPFQFGPIDLYEADFFNFRQTLIQEKKRILLSQPNEFFKTILQTYQEKFGIANPFVHWDILSIELLQLSLAVIPQAHLSLIFDRMLENLKENSSGFPDLICFDVKHKKYELIEIKGPGDKLQKNQIRWLEYFHSSNIPYQVAYVQWAK